MPTVLSDAADRAATLGVTASYRQDGEVGGAVLRLVVDLLGSVTGGRTRTATR